MQPGQEYKVILEFVESKGEDFQVTLTSEDNSAFELRDERDLAEKI